MFNTIFDTVQRQDSFTIFSTGHIFVLLIAILATFILFKFNKQNKTFEIISSLILIIDQICLYGWYYFSSESFLKRGLPLYTCRMAVVLIIVGIFSNKTILLKIGSYWGAIGSIIGLCFPTISRYNYAFPHIIHISFILLHLYLLLMSLYILFIKKIGMNLKDFKIAINFTIIYHAFTFIFNIVFGSNYAYTTKLPSVMKFSLHPLICLSLVILVFISIIVVEYSIINIKSLSILCNSFSKDENESKLPHKGMLNHKLRNKDK